jgi:O-antigen ligase
MMTARNVGLAMLVIVAISLIVVNSLNLPPELAMGALVAAGAGVYLAVKFPEWFLAAAMFAPQWKTLSVLKTLNNIVDLTIVMLACLAMGVAWQIFTRPARTQVPGFYRMFSDQSNSILAYFAFATILTVSYFYTTAPSYGASKLSRFLIIGTIYLIAPFFILLSEEDFRRFARIFVVFSELTAVQLIINLRQKTVDINAVNSNADITRIGAAWLLAMAILVVLFYPLWPNRFARAVSFWLFLPLLIVGLIASAARGPIVALLMAGLVGLLVSLAQGRVQASAAIVLLAFVFAGATVAYYFVRQADLEKYSAKASELEQLVVSGESTGSAGNRLKFYRATLEAIPDHMLFGTGIGSWAKFYYGSDLRNYPHNLFLEIAFEAGLVGLASLLILFAMVILATLRMLAASNFHFLVLGLLILFCVLASQFSGDLDDNRLIWAWIGVGLAVGRMVQLNQLAWRSLRDDQTRWASLSTASATGAAGSPSRLRQSPSLRRNATPRRADRWREKFV